jgi:HD-GYP domain-containing protein (c-di-GMP phosphodiesterase class II)
VGEMVNSFLSEKEALVHLMNLRAGAEDFCHHGLSTTILGMILGRECGLDTESMKKLGLGLLFHDIGKRYRSQKVLYTPNLLQLHPVFGEEMVSGTGRFSRDSVEIVRHHHERMDGKGFPDRLPGDRLSLLVRIASIVNAFDNCCNRPDPKTSLTPNHALAYLFAREKDRFDLQILSVFIHCLGVYPPGTVVQLSNDHVGLIASVNTRNPLRPSVLVHDEEIPKEEALLLDMNDTPDLAIVKSIHPRELDRDAFAYLNPQGRMTYFFDAPPPGPAGG